MANLIKGRFSLNLGLVKLDGELAQDDRQRAWELYTELSTRVAVTGRPDDKECTDFGGELYAESLDSLYAFFQEARNIMRGFPVGEIGTNNQTHLGVVISQAMSGVLRPFLEKWQVRYRHWWEHESNPRLPPLRRQKEFPELQEFLEDWAAVRSIMREFQKNLVATYKLTDVSAKQDS